MEGSEQKCYLLAIQSSVSQENKPIDTRKDNHPLNGCLVVTAKDQSWDYNNTKVTTPINTQRDEKSYFLTDISDCPSSGCCGSVFSNNNNNNNDSSHCDGDDCETIKIDTACCSANPSRRGSSSSRHHLRRCSTPIKFHDPLYFPDSPK